MSAALAIQNLEREHIGFVLLHFKAEPTGDGNCDGDCVIQILPKNANLFQSSLVQVLNPYNFRESGEHLVRLSKNSGKSIYQISPKTKPPLQIDLSVSGEGVLSQHPDFSNPIGRIVEVKKN